MTPYFEIQPAPFSIILQAAKNMEFYVDQYNRIYFTFKQDSKSKTRKYPPQDKKDVHKLECVRCHSQLSYFTNLGITCTDNVCHKYWMENMKEHLDNIK